MDTSTQALHYIPGRLMADDPNADDALDEDEDEEGSSKNRASKEITELYYFVLSLAYNQV